MGWAREEIAKALFAKMPYWFKGDNYYLGGCFPSRPIFIDEDLIEEGS